MEYRGVVVEEYSKTTSYVIKLPVDFLVLELLLHVNSFENSNIRKVFVPYTSNKPKRTQISCLSQLSLASIQHCTLLPLCRKTVPMESRMKESCKTWLYSRPPNQINFVYTYGMTFLEHIPILEMFFFLHKYISKIGMCYPKDIFRREKEVTRGVPL